MRCRIGGMKQFSIRDVLFVFLIVALGLGWWLDRCPVASRFQLSSSNDRVYVLDTATGRLWTDHYPPNSHVTGDGDVLPAKVTK